MDRWALPSRPCVLHDAALSLYVSCYLAHAHESCRGCPVTASRLVCMQVVVAATATATTLTLARSWCTR